MHNIEYPIEETYFLACSPLHNVYHYGSVEEENCLSTGLALIATGDNKDYVCDLIYSSYGFDEDGCLINLLLREITWSVGYNYSEAINVLESFNLGVPTVFINPIKHPEREEYALPWSEYIVSTITNSELKDALYAKHEESIAEGNVKTKEEMISEGWI